MEHYYIGDEIGIRPPVTAEVLAGSRFTAEGVDAHGGEVFVTDGYSDDHSLVVPAHCERLTSSPGSIVDDVQALVELLGAGYSYSGELRIVDPNEEPPSRVRVVKTGDTWTAVQEESEYVYPADYAVPDGMAVTFDARAAYDWLTEKVGPNGGHVRAYDYSIHPFALYRRDQGDRPGDWLDRLVNSGALPAAAWRAAPGVEIEVHETADVEGIADGSAVLTVEAGHLRLASERIEAMDFARGDPITHIEAVLQTLEHAAQVVNEMIERHRLVRAADVADVTRLSVIGGMTGQLTLHEVECALRTLAELWDGADPNDVLSSPQRQIADRLADLLAAEDAEERSDDPPGEAGGLLDEHPDEG